MTQKSIAELFDAKRSIVTKHLTNIFNDNELEKFKYVPKWNILQKTIISETIGLIL